MTEFKIKYVSNKHHKITYQDSNRVETSSKRKADLDRPENGKGEEFRVAARLSSGQITAGLLC